MTYEQFWYGDAELYWAYQTFFINKQEEQQERDNNFAWLQGLYMWKAFNVVEYNMNKKQNDPAEYYFEKPINFDEDKNDMIKTEQEKFDNRMKAYLVNQKMKLDKSNKKGNK